MASKKNKKKNRSRKGKTIKTSNTSINSNILSESSSTASINMDKDSQRMNLKENIELHKDDESIKTIQNKSGNNKMQFMDLLDMINKLVTCLKSKETNTFVLIFQNLLNVTTLEIKNREMFEKVMYAFLNSLQECGPDELDLISQKLKSEIIPKSLRQLMVDNADLTEQHFIGSGAFGVVVFGYLSKNNKCTPVAIKQSKDDNDTEALENEIKIMSELNHPNILKLLAVQKTPLRLVAEYMPLGNIHQAVKEKNFRDDELLKIVQDVATGMEYLAEKKFVHRDLSCRNIFVDDSNNRITCKVGDFGTCCYVGDTNGVYEEKAQTFFQVGMAPEAINTQKFTMKTDVYTMGVVIWDLYMIAAHQIPSVPYIPFVPPFLLGRMDFVLKQFSTTGYLEKPRRISDDLFMFVTNRLLNNNPEIRPTFTEIKEEIIMMSHKK